MAFLTATTGTIIIDSSVPRGQEPLHTGGPSGDHPAFLAPMYYILGLQRGQQPVSVGGGGVEVGPLLAVFPSLFGNQLRIYFGAEIDQTLAATVNPASYSVSTPSGLVTVVSVAREDSSVVLTLASVPIPGSCSVTIVEDAALSAAGGHLEETTLLFQGPEPFLAVSAAPSLSTLRVYFGADLDQAFAPTSNPASYSVSTPAGALAVTAVAVEARSVVLTLSAPPSAGLCFVSIAAGAARSEADGGLVANTTLSFFGLVPLLAVSAALNVSSLRVYFGADLDASYGPSIDPESYTVSTPSGDISVTLATVEARSVVLTLSSPPPSGSCSVVVAAGAVRSTSGSSVAETTLAFQGPVPLLAVSAAVDEADLRIYFGSTLDAALPATSSPDSYSVSTPSGPIEIVSVTVEANAVVLHLEIAPPAEDCTVTVEANAARSTAGSYVAETTFSFVGADFIAPAVSNFDPPLGHKLHTNSTVSFDVKDNRDLQRTLLVVRFNSTGLTELVHDGVAFRNAYQGSRTEIAGGFRFSVSRRTGWPAAPTFQVFATDASGNEQ